MNLKQALLAILETEQLKELCAEFELEADRRSREAMAGALASARRAKPELFINKLTVKQLKAVLVQFEQSTNGKKEELVQRLLIAGGRAWPLPEATRQTAEEAPSAYQVIETAGARAACSDVAGEYRHTDQAVQRPDAGVQDQFQARKPPKTYRYDSSLDPALSWDEQRERDLGEWLLGLVIRSAKEGEQTVFAEPQEWKGGGVRVTSLTDAAQMLQQISKPFLNWAGKAERHEIKVPTAPLFVHERHSTKAILDGIRHRKARGQTLDLFGDPGMDIRENLEAYEHKGPWQNRMILGDSLVAMNSLLEFEGMAGQVQMIYIDPPYGVKFGSNFQPFVRKRDVKHGGDDDITREPEMVKAYRDTWELGLHSYLTYLRDRLMVAKELLHETGSLFLQISDENLHHCRELLDEVFGEDHFVSLISFAKAGGGLESTSRVSARLDYLIWYAKNPDHLKYRRLFEVRSDPIADGFDMVETSDGTRRRVTRAERAGEVPLPADARLFGSVTFSKPGPGAKYEVELNGKVYTSGRRWWGLPKESLLKVIAVGRTVTTENEIRFVKYLSDFPFRSMSNLWDRLGGAANPLYVVQTNPTVVQRCMLMCTDPGDLVLDPTCGSGTTAYVAEQWGRRWITIDTSRVPLALARQRLLTATFPYYELKSPQAGPAGGFVYKRKQNRKGEEIGGLVPHITLKSIANDEPPAMEVLVDRPEKVANVTRVAGPFVVEATIAPVQPLDSAGEGDVTAHGDAAIHIQRMTEVLRQSKTLRLPGNRELTLAGVRRTVDTEYLHAEAKDGDKRVAIVFGPADGAISVSLVFESAREGYFLKYDRLYFFGFAIEPGARSMIEDEKKLRIPAAYVTVTPDVAMSDLLKTTRASEIFSITGLPDVTVRRSKKRGPEGQVLHEVELKGLDLFDPQSMDTESVGGENVPCWMLDTDYDGLSFYATQVFFPKTSAWDNLQRSLRATFDDSVWSHLAGTVSEPFALGDRKRVAVKVIDERGNELMRVLDVAE
ncbi:DNA methyltransferase [Acidithiobacillus caldus]|jgi:adenine-specific DNA-methyltransferase|uniref:site-specific DNA-methyltransferase (adenine-specific) n=2 Tax=Acidithiobacillus caldus TaxID=33059 RepID=A0A059ZX94_ACICK|nr:DNA methyltransferase [Acidithiobacillus caldus]AIA54537.1 putative DNA methylase [Acidithiobacillus caldus ATCC 51756]